MKQCALSCSADSLRAPGARPEVILDRSVRHRARGRKSATRMDSSTRQGRTPSDESGVRAHQASARSSAVVHLLNCSGIATYHHFEGRFVAELKEDDNGEGNADCNSCPFTKFPANNRTRYILDLKTAINILRQLTTELQREERPPYRMREIRERKGKQLQKGPARDRFHDSAQRPDVSRVHTSQSAWSAVIFAGYDVRRLPNLTRVFRTARTMLMDAR
jgi:hypothetical protein